STTETTRQSQVGCTTQFQKRSTLRFSSGLFIKSRFVRLMMVSQFALMSLLNAVLVLQDQGVAMQAQPPLPGTSEENWTVKRFRLIRSTSICDNWTSKRKKLGELARGAVVSGLPKLSVVYEPDIVSVTAPVPKFGLNVGDTTFRYTEE